MAAAVQRHAGPDREAVLLARAQTTDEFVVPDDVVPAPTHLPSSTFPRRGDVHRRRQQQTDQAD